MHIHLSLGQLLGTRASQHGLKNRQCPDRSRRRKYGIAKDGQELSVDPTVSQSVDDGFQEYAEAVYHDGGAVLRRGNSPELSNLSKLRCTITSRYVSPRRRVRAMYHQSAIEFCKALSHARSGIWRSIDRSRGRKRQQYRGGPPGSSTTRHTEYPLIPSIKPIAYTNNPAVGQRQKRPQKGRRCVRLAPFVGRGRLDKSIWLEINRLR